MSRRKETTRKTKCKWEDNIKVYLTEIIWVDMDLILLAQDRDQWLTLVGMVMNLLVALNVKKFLSN
jgi:hypothetical protein